MGDRFAFGEIKSKDDFTQDNYIGGGKDVVKEKWGGEWRLPTSSELDELVEECSFNLNNIDGTDVIEVIGPNGNSMIMPYSFYGSDGEGWYGFYWSSSVCSSDKAYILHFNKSKREISWGSFPKYYGCLVRGVINNPNYSSSGGSNGNGNSGGGSSGSGNGGNSGENGSSNDHHYPCNSCGETGDCWNCFGTGKDPITRKTCNICHGTGKCQICRGKGYIIV